ncbi:MAG: M6 family metalloprotease domain-containing protein [Candidatus Latescibacteria bacterium]|nr:M6 family metalloprotease domain-containing protein [Candidatus Latescibacterota bacterium]NIM22118.1 M6 family metalloprotease domain-containing protein [Candidatus Latescibacterota bacterium]NIM64668.1 M6 family metalloprotease domain-containing protein [Candidatus Latescibacterota bacterium]NIO01178.1 M6 family metalloprotease domain-containing protein [Candidatus Latescibacterota bacterium]NIO27563.1 M6 family metalloprotease domain-containing protein [Candidatus Latescibacterota bacteri
MKTIAIAAGLLLLLAAAAGGIVPPKNGGRLPEAYYARKAEDKRAFQVDRAWTNKARNIKAKREAFLHANGVKSVAYLPEEYSLSGDFFIPVLLGKFTNRPDTVPSADIQQELFDGPWPPGTMTEYFAEVSYGMLNATGTVYPWFEVSQTDIYYAGCCKGLGFDAKTGQFLLELLNHNDPIVNFGQYDNDGPDGVPNSGDDDGYVDFTMFVHNESGGECGGDNLWSHSWVFRGWAESGGGPYVTNDAAAGGGFIKVDAYTVQPAYSCALTMIEIGVYCHESGHAFGLPDLYDANGPFPGPEGIGHWGIMGSGSWNTPSQPSHPCAWTRKELGWIVPTEVDWQGSAFSIPQIETNPVAYKLAFTDERFRRLAECAIAGSHSLRCGVTNEEGDSLHWDGRGGYGNGWDESIERDFDFDGTTPVMFSYDYQYDIETDYDYAYTLIRVNSTETVLRTYTGNLSSGTESIDLSPVLSGHTPPIDYQLIFRFVSDYSWSDEDNKNPTLCGAIILDNVSVTGGGESYSTDFETSVDGWHQGSSQNPASEYWLVENRQQVGFDANLHNTGLLIWHIDEDIIHSLNGNCGSPCSDDTPKNDAARGVVLEEADGQQNLPKGDNRGDPGDPFPGTSNNTTFDSGSNPNSNDNTGQPTLIAVTNIGPSGPSISANLKAGDPAPALVQLDPDSSDNNVTTIDVTVDGNYVKYGATMRLTRTGETDIDATSLEWVDPTRIRGTFYIYGRLGGFWDLALTNPDAQEAVLPNALHLNQIVAAKLQSASVSLIDGGIEIRFALEDLSLDEKIVLRRSLSPDGPWADLPGPIEETGQGAYVYVDREVEPGKTYFYRLDTETPDGRVTELYRDSATVPSRDLVLEQNYPNPFNPSTTIYFYLPAESKIRLEIFDVSGRLVRALATGVFQTGPHRSEWDGRNQNGERVSSGVYVYRLTAGKQMLSRKMVVLK